MRTVGSEWSPLDVGVTSEIASGDRLLSAAPKIIEGFSGDDRVCDTRKPEGFAGTWASTGRGVEDGCDGDDGCDFGVGIVLGVCDEELIKICCSLYVPEMNKTLQ